MSGINQLLTRTSLPGGFARSGAVGAGIALLLLWWALHGVAFSDFAHHLRAVRVLPFLGSVALATLTLPLRAVRWRYLLRPDRQILPVIPLFHATSIGMMVNNLLPARTGEIARAYAVRSLTTSPFSTALGSIVVERAMDGMTIVGLMIVPLVLGGFAPGGTVAGLALTEIASWAAAVFGLALLAALVSVVWPESVQRVSARICARVLPESWAGRAAQFVSGLIAGLESLRNLHLMAAVAAWSLVIWCVNAAAIWLGLSAFEIGVPWTAALLLQALVAFGVALPSSAGFFGPLEAASRAALALYGVGAAQALSFSLAFHIFAYFAPQTLIGLWSLSRGGLQFSQLPRNGTKVAGGREPSPRTPS